MSGHAPDESSNGVRVERNPDLNEAIGELLDRRRWYEVLDALTRTVPKVLIWIYAKGTCGSVSGINAFIIQRVPRLHEELAALPLRSLRLTRAPVACWRSLCFWGQSWVAALLQLTLWCNSWDKLQHVDVPCHSNWGAGAASCC